MTIEKPFKISLLISIVFHSILLISSPQFNALIPKIIKKEPPEIEYQPQAKAPVISDLLAKKEKGKDLIQTNKIDREEIHKKNNYKKTTSRNSIEDKPFIRRFESEKVVPINEPEGEKLIYNKEKDLSSNPRYLNYYNIIRAKIYNEALKNRPYTSIEGEVKLIFTLDNNGRLLQLDTLPISNSTNYILKNYALSSIKNASPFPPFLQSMNNDQLTLQVTICFEE